MKKTENFKKKLAKYLQKKSSDIFRIEIPKQKIENTIQFIQFGIVGVSNTIISYIVYVFFIYMGVHYFFANIYAFFISVTNSFYWNNKYVFIKEENENRTLLKSMIKTFLSYASTGLILNNILLYVWIDALHVNQILAPIINLFFTIPLNFILNKLWAFKKDNK